MNETLIDHQSRFSCVGVFHHADALCCCAPHNPHTVVILFHLEVGDGTFSVN